MVTCCKLRSTGRGCANVCRSNITLRLKSLASDLITCFRSTPLYMMFRCGSGFGTRSCSCGRVEAGAGVPPPNPPLSPPALLSFVEVVAAMPCFTCSRRSIRSISDTASWFTGSYPNACRKAL